MSSSFATGRSSSLASPSQSHRFCGPVAAASGSGSFDTLNSVIGDLCSSSNPKEGAALAFRKHAAVRDLSGEASSRFMEQLYDRIAKLIESKDGAKNMGGLRAIDELTEIGFGENATKVSRFAGYMRTVFESQHREPQVLVLASRVLGHLARAGGAMTSDEVEFHMKASFDWLHGDRVEYRRLAAVLILKEMAENASTVFNVMSLNLWMPSGLH